MLVNIKEEFVCQFMARIDFFAEQNSTLTVAVIKGGENHVDLSSM